VVQQRAAPSEAGSAGEGLSAPTLLFRDGPLAGRRFPIAERLMLGRENADIVVDDPEVSRQHAMMRWSDGRLELSDLRSANGTFLNRERIAGPQELRDGDVVMIGQTSIVVELPPARDPGATVLRAR
jgi:pSer/pThr/pTyr-binding forkhead associated (FHA) protein